MVPRRQILIGSLLLFFGLLFLVGEIFKIDVGRICWPIGLILIGLWLLFRPRVFAVGSGINLRPFGDVRRIGAWQVTEEETWMFVGDVRLDMSRAEIPLGETVIRVNGFVGDIDLLAPKDVGISVASTAFLTTTKAWGQKMDRFVSTFSQSSPNYEQAERKIRLETLFFVLDLTVEQVEEVTHD